MFKSLTIVIRRSLQTVIEARHDGKHEFASNRSQFKIFRPTHRDGKKKREKEKKRGKKGEKREKIKKRNNLSAVLRFIE